VLDDLVGDAGREQLVVVLAGDLVDLSPNERAPIELIIR
jgi:hypothetical protein